MIVHMHVSLALRALIVELKDSMQTSTATLGTKITSLSEQFTSFRDELTARVDRQGEVIKAQIQVVQEAVDSTAATVTSHEDRISAIEQRLEQLQGGGAAQQLQPMQQQLLPNANWAQPYDEDHPIIRHAMLRLAAHGVPIDGGADAAVQKILDTAAVAGTFTGAQFVGAARDGKQTLLFTLETDAQRRQLFTQLQQLKSAQTLRGLDQQLTPRQQARRTALRSHPAFRRVMDTVKQRRETGERVAVRWFWDACRVGTEWWIVQRAEGEVQRAPRATVAGGGVTPPGMTGAGPADNTAGA